MRVIGSAMLGALAAASLGSLASLAIGDGVDLMDAVRPLKGNKGMTRYPKGYNNSGKGSIADKPHAHSREIARRLRQQARASA